MALNKMYGKRFASAIVLSALLTITLFYLTFEVPNFLDKVLHQYFPEVSFDVEAIEKMLSTLRPIGYASLTVTITIIVLGFINKKSALTFLGSLALYLPTFGYFAFAMFFLTGLGALRALWLPILEFSPSILKLGCIVYIPISVIPYAPLIGMVITFIGLLVFSLAATTWLYGRFRGYELIDFWIYKYSRHPQYLGFILWSYGLLIFVSYKTYVKGALATPPALIWLVSAMIVIGIALFEEIEMVKKHGERYEEYRKRTPFMIPLPRPLTKLIMLPMKIVGGYPKSMRDVIGVVMLYTAILVALSYILMVILGP
ncbi:MAG: DUF1295 domain-containing protein [Candidatus Nezhaarchaeales archaeon]